MQAEQIFISGLLHDMGKVIFAVYFPRDYKAAFEYAKKNEIDLYKSEKLILGIDHAALSGLLMERWNFPDTILMPTCYHHSVDQCPTKFQQLALIIAFSDFLSQKAEDLKNGKEEIEAFFEVMK